MSARKSERLALPETQWRALMDMEPEPIAWLR